MFRGIPKEEVRLLLDELAQQKEFAKGEVIYSPQDFKRSLGILCQGRVVAKKENGVILNRMSAGDCFGAAALVGVPLFFLAKASLGTTTAALCMILVMLPFFLFAMYEKNGQPLEVFLGHLIQNKFIRPKVRIYQTNNLYSALVRQSQLEQEVKRIARKGRKTGKA